MQLLAAESAESQDISEALISLDTHADSHSHGAENQLIQSDLGSLVNKHSFSRANQPSFHMNSATFDAMTIMCNDAV